MKAKERKETMEKGKTKYDLQLLCLTVSAVTDGPEENVMPHIWAQIEQALFDLREIREKVQV